MTKIINMLFFIPFLASSCHFDDKKANKHIDEFYTYTHDGNQSRIPLLDPFELSATYNKGPQSWGFELPFGSIRYQSQINEIKLAGIKDSIFVIYTPNFYTPEESKSSGAWLVVDAARKKQRLYTRHKDYLQYLRTLNTDSIRLYDVDKLFEAFDKHNELPREWPCNK